MFLTQGQVERGHFTNNRYGTAGTTTQTTLASSGGLLINIDSATGDTPITASGWIESEAYGWYMTRVATNASAEFDTAVTRTGTKTLKLSTTNTTGRLVASQRGPDILASIPVKGSTKYKLSCFVKTTTVAAASACLKLEEYNSAGTLGTTTTSNTLTGTNDWTLCTATFTTASTAVKCIPFCSLNVAGNISDAWFDVNSMTLEEVVEPVANSLTSSSPSLVSFTAVGSTDNIDQSQLTGTTGSVIGNFGGLSYMFSQSFTPTKSKLTGVYLYKRANTGTPTGNLKVDIRTNSAGDPSSTILATYTMPLATYNALTTNAEFLVNLPCNLTAGTLYHIVISDTATEASGNYFNIGGNSAGGYTGGDSRSSTNGGTTWAVAGTADQYFKTLYYKPTTNFKASQNNSTVSISADEDGFLNGSVYNLSTGTATFTETFGTFYLLQYTESGSDLIAEVNLPGVGLSASFTSDRTLEYSSDGITYEASFPTGFSKVWVKILAYSGFASFSYSIQFSTESIATLRNYPTNKDIIKQYSTTLGSPSTSATYRATKWGFPAIEYGSDTNIDQSQLTVNGANVLGTGVVAYFYQQFLPTQSRFMGVVIQREVNTGTFVGNIEVKIRNDNAGVPGTTVLANYTIPNATWNSLAIDTDYTVNLPCTLTVDGSTKYWIQVNTTTSDGSNYTRINLSTTNVYADGLCKYGLTENVITGTYAGDLYFKTLYSTTEAQFLDVDTTATGSTVAFSELGTSYTTVADGASISITSTSTPNIFVKTNITANRLYLSSNDYVASSDKDGSLKQSVVYQVIQ